MHLHKNKESWADMNGMPVPGRYTDLAIFRHAVRFARLGQYSDAERALLKISTPEAFSQLILELKAKMAAQQGKLIEAEKYWSEALRKDPLNPDYQRGLAQLYVKQGSAPRLLYVLLLLVLIVTILIRFEYAESKKTRELEKISVLLKTLSPELRLAVNNESKLQNETIVQGLADLKQDFTALRSDLSSILTYSYSDSRSKSKDRIPLMPSNSVMQKGNLSSSTVQSNTAIKAIDHKTSASISRIQ